MITWWHTIHTSVILLHFQPTSLIHCLRLRITHFPCVLHTFFNTVNKGVCKKMYFVMLLVEDFQFAELDTFVQQEGLQCWEDNVSISTVFSNFFNHISSTYWSEAFTLQIWIQERKESLESKAVGGKKESGSWRQSIPKARKPTRSIPNQTRIMWGWSTDT